MLLIVYNIYIWFLPFIVVVVVVAAAAAIFAAWFDNIWFWKHITFPVCCVPMHWLSFTSFYGWEFFQIARHTCTHICTYTKRARFRLSYFQTDKHQFSKSATHNSPMYLTHQSNFRIGKIHHFFVFFKWNRKPKYKLTQCDYKFVTCKQILFRK